MGKTPATFLLEFIFNADIHEFMNLSNIVTTQKLGIKAGYASFEQVLEKACFLCYVFV